ncbi:MAG: RNase adapter RapZ [Bdellovibrionota bacterium]
MKTVIVSGVSGSGKSVAYKTFENLGYHCMDNVPVQMLSYYQSYFQQYKNDFDKVVSVVDARDTNGINTLPDPEIQKWKKHDQSIEILFLDARDHVLIQRYSETRHRHPLSPKGSIEMVSPKNVNFCNPFEILPHCI